MRLVLRQTGPRVAILGRTLATSQDSSDCTATKSLNRLKLGNVLPYYESEDKLYELANCSHRLFKKFMTSKFYGDLN